jgi:hypothetical protein
MIQPTCLNFKPFLKHSIKCEVNLDETGIICIRLPRAKLKLFIRECWLNSFVTVMCAC